MFQCIGCGKQTDDHDDQDQRDEGARDLQKGKSQKQEPIKTLTAQLKDLVMKFSGSFKQSSRSGPGSSSRVGGRRPIQYPEITIGDRVHHPYRGGSLQILSGRSDQSIALGGADQTPRSHESVAANDVVVAEADDGQKWVAQVEPGITITFETLPNGDNDLKRVRFCPETFTRLDAQGWWYDNFDRLIELYNVKKINGQDVLPRLEDAQGDISFPVQSPANETGSPVAAWLHNHGAPPPGFEYQSPAPAITFDQVQENMQQQQQQHSGPSNMQSDGAAMDDELDPEWIEQDQEGVYITIRVTPDGSKLIRRLKFSHEMFDEEGAKRWWDENRERILSEYL